MDQSNKYIPVFLWIENHHSIKNQGFHFTNKYVFTYDTRNRELKRKKNENYIDGFFGDNINVTAIVGANGSGKTTVLTAIMELFDFNIQKNVHFIMAFDNDIVWVSEKEEISYYKFDSNSDSIFLRSENKRGSYSFWEPKPPISCIYYSQAMDWNQYLNSNRSIINLASGNFLKCSEESKRGKYYIPNGDYFKKEFYKQLQYIENFAENIGFKLPEYADVNVVGCDVNQVVVSLTDYVIYSINNNVEKVKYLYLKKYSEKTGISHATLHRQFFGKIDKDKISKYFEDVVSVFIQNSSCDIYGNMACLVNRMTETLFCEFCGCFGGRLDAGVSFEYLVRNICSISLKDDRNNNCWEMLGILISSICSEIEELNGTMYEAEQAEIKSFLNLYNYINELLLKDRNDKYTFDEYRDLVFSIPLNERNINENVPFHITLKQFWQKYESLSKYCNIFEFSWALSSGEISRIELYSRLYNVVKSDKWQKGEFNLIYKKENSILLLIDEADMLLHPEWQRTFISDILKIFPKIFKDQFINVIIATHSPIMLSDIPRQNVLFLTSKQDHNSNLGIGIDEQGCDTFAANIFQLFREAFFIGDTGIGAYAEEKLKEIVSLIHSKNDNNEALIKKYISAVGDSFLRHKLEQEYLIYRTKSNSTESEQVKRIKELENERNCLNAEKAKDTEFFKNILSLLNHENKSSQYKRSFDDYKTEEGLKEIIKKLENRVKQGDVES